MKVLGVIPARGGSKRCPGKNIADLGGKPLIQWTLDAAMESKVFDQIIVSTEDLDIAKVVQQNPRNKEVEVHRRPASLAEDDTPTLPVIQYVNDNFPADVVITLQCTSPFRTAEDIKESLMLLLSMNAESVISTTEGPDDLAFSVGWGGRLRSIPKIAVANGALYLIKGANLQRGDSWYSGALYGYPMPKDRSLDIDTIQDLELARYMASRNGYAYQTDQVMPSLKAAHRTSRTLYSQEQDL